MWPRATCHKLARCGLETHEIGLQFVAHLGIFFSNNYILFTVNLYNLVVIMHRLQPSLKFNTLLTLYVYVFERVLCNEQSLFHYTVFTEW
jgi:hypothetical protein